MAGFANMHMGYKGYWICFNKSKYSLTMPAYASICLENADYRLSKKKYLQSDWLRGVQYWTN